MDATINSYSQMVRPDMIEVGQRMRPVDKQAVEMLKESIQSHGLLHPLTVCGFEEKNGRVSHRLIAGRHRLEAVRELGWNMVACKIVSADALHAELLEIDENLMRNDLKPAERGAFTGRRAKVIAQIAEEAKKVSGQDGRKSGRPSEPASAAGLARKTGRPERTVRRDMERANALGVETLEKLAGTSLDRGTELDALIKLPQAARDEVIRRVLTGERVLASKVKVSARSYSIRSEDDEEKRKKLDKADAKREAKNELANLTRRLPLVEQAIGEVLRAAAGVHVPVETKKAVIAQYKLYIQKLESAVARLEKQL